MFPSVCDSITDPLEDTINTKVGEYIDAQDYGLFTISDQCAFIRNAASDCMDLNQGTLESKVVWEENALNRLYST